MIITIEEYGSVGVEVDEQEYLAAKAAGRLDHFLDVYASDMDTETTITEPDGTEFGLYE